MLALTVRGWHVEREQTVCIAYCRDAAAECPDPNASHQPVFVILNVISELRGIVCSPPIIRFDRLDAPILQVHNQGRYNSGAGPRSRSARTFDGQFPAVKRNPAGELLRQAVDQNSPCRAGSVVSCPRHVSRSLLAFETFLSHSYVNESAGDSERRMLIPDPQPRRPFTGIAPLCGSASATEEKQDDRFRNEKCS